MPTVAVVDCRPGDRERLARLEAAVPTTVWDGAPDAGELTRRAAAAGVLATLYTYTKVPRAVIESLPDLRMVITRTAGSSHIDAGAAAERGVVVATVPDAPTTAVAEYTFWAAIALRRDLVASAESAAAGEWLFTGFRGRELAGHTLGVVGLGHIGARVAQIGAAFGMHVLGWSRSRKDLADVEQVELDDLLARSDVVSLNVPLTPETDRLLDARRLALLRPQAVLVNTARGEIADLGAICEMLRAGRLGGACVDVLEEEPQVAAERLAELAQVPRLLVTPHIAWHTEETLDRQFDGMIDRIIDFCAIPTT